MQKDLAKLTGILGGILTICLISMSVITRNSHSSIAAGAVAPPNKTDAPRGAGNPFGLGGTGGRRSPMDSAAARRFPRWYRRAGLEPRDAPIDCAGATQPVRPQPGATTPGLRRARSVPTAPRLLPSAGSQPGAHRRYAVVMAPGTATPPATPGLRPGRRRRIHPESAGPSAEVKREGAAPRRLRKAARAARARAA
jgi:hypothetical protein